MPYVAPPSGRILTSAQLAAINKEANKNAEKVNPNAEMEKEYGSSDGMTRYRETKVYANEK